MLKKIVGSLIVTLLFAAVSAQEINNTNLELIHGPYLQNLSAEGVTIMWQTNLPSIPGVRIEDKSGNQWFIRNSNDGMVDGGGTTHKVRVTGLNPGELYSYTPVSTQIMKYQAYRVYYGDTIARKTYHFTTPLESDRELSFTVVNDIHENSGLLSDFLENSSGVNSDLYFFNGDMIDYFQSDNQIFDGFLDTAVEHFASEHPFYFIRGNHETRGMLARSFKSYFDFPSDRFYYAFTRSGVRFIVLDCGEDKPDNNRYYYGLAAYDGYRMEQLEWLKEEVKSNEFTSADFRVVLVHMPIIKEEKQGHGMNFLSENFGPVLSGKGVDLMVSGHTHQMKFLGRKESGFSYPVLISSNKTYLNVTISKKKLIWKLMEADGKVLMSDTLR